MILSDEQFYISVRKVPWSTPCQCDDPDRTDVTPVNGRHVPPLIHLMNEQDTSLVEQNINARHWVRIWEHTHITKFNTTPPTLSHASLNYDSATDWFFLTLNSFEVEKLSHLQVEFKAEAEEYRWKKGMFWDFLELRQLPNRF